MERFDLSEQMYLTSLENRKTFDDWDSFRYFPGTAQCQRSLGALYELDFADNAKAEVCYLQAVELLRPLCQHIPERCNVINPLTKSLWYLFDLYQKMGEGKKAEAIEAEMEAFAATDES